MLETELTEYENPERISVEKPESGIEAYEQLGSVFPEFRMETWEGLSLEERRDALQKLEDYLADVQGRTVCRIELEDMAPGTHGHFCGSSITLNRNDCKNPAELQHIAQTLIHEGVHAYQKYAVEHPGTHPDAAECECWRENRKNYLDSKTYGMELYRNQPVERHARETADAIMTVAQKSGFCV